MGATVIAIFLLCLNLILMIVFYRSIARTFSQNAYRDKIREEVNKLIMDIQHESDHAVSVLEDKIRHVQKMLADVDRHIALAEQEHEKWIDQQQFLQKQENRSSPAQPEHVKKETIPIYIKPPLKNIPPEIPASVSPQEQVLELARQGFSLDFIAGKVDLPIGEIALILSLHA